MVTRHNEYHGIHFRATHGTTQGGLTYSTLFNFVVDNVVWNWLSVTVENDMNICDGLVHVVGHSMGFLYVDDGIIGSRVL